MYNPLVVTVAIRQLVSEISVDDEAEYDPTEHDWRHQVERLNAGT